LKISAAVKKRGQGIPATPESYLNLILNMKSVGQISSIRL